MIDQTNARIGEAAAELRRRKARREAFERLVRLTDVVLWGLEEMNREGLVALPPPREQDIRRRLAVMPDQIKRLYCPDGTVQGALDSLFEIQGALFKARNPDLDYDDPEFDQD